MERREILFFRSGLSSRSWLCLPPAALRRLLLPLGSEIEPVQKWEGRQSEFNNSESSHAPRSPFEALEWKSCATGWHRFAHETGEILSPAENSPKPYSRGKRKLNAPSFLLHREKAGEEG